MWTLQRTHHCGALGLSDVGATVCLNGFVKARRDHGGLIFIDLGDRYGITQVVFNPTQNPAIHQQAETLRTGSVIAVKGKVKQRPQGMANPHLSTGAIELEASSWKLSQPALHLHLK